MAISSPHSLTAHLGYPVARRMQRKFGRDSLATMQHVIHDDH
jgi:hypothetical protein